LIAVLKFFGTCIWCHAAVIGQICLHATNFTPITSHITEYETNTRPTLQVTRQVYSSKRAQNWLQKHQHSTLSPIQLFNT